MVHGWVLLICCFIYQAVILYGSIKQHPLMDRLVIQSTKGMMV
jgi:hypothetical protein